MTRPLVSLFLTTPTIILILLLTPLSISKSGKNRLQLLLKIRILPSSLEDNLAIQIPFSSPHEHKILDWSISTCTLKGAKQPLVILLWSSIKQYDLLPNNPNFIQTYPMDGICSDGKHTSFEDQVQVLFLCEFWNLYWEFSWWVSGLSPVLSIAELTDNLWLEANESGLKILSVEIMMCALSVVIKET